MGAGHWCNGPEVPQVAEPRHGGSAAAKFPGWFGEAAVAEDSVHWLLREAASSIAETHGGEASAGRCAYAEGAAVGEPIALHTSHTTDQ